LSKSLEQSQVHDLRKQIIDELEENLRLYRSHNGLDTNFAKDEYILEDLRSYLEIQEELRSLDIDFLKEYTGWKSKTIEDQIKKDFLANAVSQNRHGSAFMETDAYKVSKQMQVDLLEKVERRLEQFNKREDDFPVKRGKVFRGVTVHFSTSDVDEMRTFLDSVPDYKKKIDVPNDTIIYTIECHIAPMSGGIQSIWIYLGTQEVMTEKEEDEEEKDDAK
jgi:hypothetical protein